MEAYSGTGISSLEQSFWPSLRALAGQFSTHWAQATHLASSTSATKLERIASRAPNIRPARRPKQAQAQQLQMAAESPASSMLGMSCMRPFSSARLMISSTSSFVICLARPERM